MSEALTRAQFEALVESSTLRDHDAALRQEIERLTVERDQSWNRFAVVGNHADFLQRLDTLLLTSAQAEQTRDQLATELNEYVFKLEKAEQERDRLQHTVEEQRATITYLEGLRHE